jgi:hypothetical protein
MGGLQPSPAVILLTYPGAMHRLWQTRTRKAFGSVVVGAILVGLVAACGGQTTQSREAAPLEDTEGFAVGGVLSDGSSVCITNSSSVELYITFSKFDAVENDGNVARGSTACGRGDFVNNPNLVGEIYASKWRKTFQVEAGNQLLGSPWVQIKGENCETWGRAQLLPGVLGSTDTWSDGALVMKVKRDRALTVDGVPWANYRVDVTDAKKPGWPSDCWV